MGHTQEYEDCEITLKLIMPYKPEMKIKEYIVNENCQTYIDKSQYINVLKKIYPNRRMIEIN